ncbi:hypothetical protein CTAYLR_003286 [Chrysophaeum taylorii]|uniref:RING-type domain-containing protein n=1 Tax=Chrysophaeum taylorii TaxID=2483200 RepID=A0AAD7XK17_9STRA|nr:hypothetical protein CTAYLR_003286 [Chrysophaeum taylorii]
MAAAREVICIVDSEEEEEEENSVVRRKRKDSESSVELIDVVPAEKTTPPSSRSSEKKKRRRKEERPAMQRGARAATCLNDVDQSFDNLRADDRTAVLASLFEASVGALKSWRVGREKRKGSSTLWALVAACDAENGYALSREAKSLPPALEHSKAGDVTTASALAYMRRRLEATRNSAEFEARLSVDAVDDGDFACTICMCEFRAADLVFCSGAALHAVCKPCLNGLCVRFSADKGLGSAHVECPEPSCRALFSRRDVVACVSPLDLMTMDERERDASMRAGLSGDATLRCVCGAVGAVPKTGIVACPDCDRRYCGSCGNLDHSPNTCPPPSDGTDRWIAKKTKPCPKCKEAIEKNLGCAHMTCRCGHQFCWLCLGPYPNCHCNHFNHQSEALAARLQRDEILDFGDDDDDDDDGDDDVYGGFSPRHRRPPRTRHRRPSFRIRRGAFVPMPPPAVWPPLWLGSSSGHHFVARPPSSW